MLPMTQIEKHRATLQKFAAAKDDAFENSVGPLEPGDRVLAYVDAVADELVLVVTEDFCRTVGAKDEVSAPTGQF